MTGPNDAMNEGGQGHPLPDSAEARSDQIPEHLIREKGHGDDAHAPASPSVERVAPDGEHYKVGPDGSSGAIPRELFARSHVCYVADTFERSIPMAKKSSGGTKDGGKTSADRIPDALKEAGRRAADLARNPVARSLLAAGLVTA